MEPFSWGRLLAPCLFRQLNDWEVETVEHFLLTLQGRRVYRELEIGMTKFCGLSQRMRLSLSRPCTRLWSEEDKALTSNHIQRRGWSLVNRCFLCLKGEESVDHILLHCDRIRVLWNLLFSLFITSWVLPSSVRGASRMTRSNNSVFPRKCRNYGASDGYPSQHGITMDAQAALDHLSQRIDIDTSRIVVFGRSLGGAVGAVLTKNNPDKVFLKLSKKVSSDFTLGVSEGTLRRGGDFNLDLEQPSFSVLLADTLYGIGGDARCMILWQVDIVAIIWVAWMERNAKIFEDRGRSSINEHDLLALPVGGQWRFLQNGSLTRGLPQAYLHLSPLGFFGERLAIEVEILALLEASPLVLKCELPWLTWKAYHLWSVSFLQVAALILENTFTSILDMAGVLLPFLKWFIGGSGSKGPRILNCLVRSPWSTIDIMAR
ncbi:Protein ABHD13 [Vitis vinifera]|uniref:Protein ABHD13 n=1 Tax=Vitis vinifera TaxID=29760 RepID=A0A438J8Z3_VITVI|nr:Protein ABHD13 [Vitis vinifera]